MRTAIWILVMTLTLGTAWAQGEVSVALVNIEQVLREARSVRAAIDAIDAEVAARQRHLQQREDELLRLIEDYRSQSSLFSEETRGQLQRDIVERRLELSELETDLRDLIDQNEQEVITPTFERIYQVIRQIAEENDIDLVLRSDAAVYAAEDLDLTDEVIDLLNRQEDEALNLPEEGEEDQ